MKTLRALGPYFRRYPRRLAAGLLCNLLSAAVGLAAPILVGRAVDAFREQVTSETLLGYAGALLGVTALMGVFSFGQRMLLVTLSRNIERDLRDDYFGHLQTLPPAFYQRSYTGDLMARGTNDLQAVRMLCGPAIMYTASTLFTAGGSLAFMLGIHGKLTLVALATMPLVALATKFFGQRIHVLFERVQEQFSTLSTRVQENLAGVRVVRAYAREDAEERSFAAVNDEYVERNRRLIRWNAAFHPLLQALVGFGFVGVLWYGGRLVWSETISIGQFVTFNFFLMELVWPMIAIGWVINLAQRGSASMGRLLDVLETRPEIRDEPPLVEDARIDGEVSARSLTFAYPETTTPVLRDIDLEVPAGSTLAVVGRTGSGKTTLLSLVARLANPPEGTLFVDGHDVRRLPLADLRAALAVVPQETFLFSTTVRENVALGRPRASDDEIRRAVEIAGLDGDLADFPDGLDTLVGERGITLSGGQKQRVALARAVLREPRVLLLDDCLSAVDTHTEETILGNLRQVFVGRTVFLVSHRISTVRSADQIIVLEGGRITERGTHDSLLELDGLYADLHRRQQLEEELEAV
ncbi:MAG: ABC transporter ATP-binding protein [Thermoanaerobaculia bacterium]